MTVPAQENQAQDAQPNNKELNFRALEQKFQQQLAHERAEKEKLALELQQRQQPNRHDDEEEDSEPYVDHKRLRKEQAKFGQQIKQETQTEIQKAVHAALKQERETNWLKNNSDFNDIMRNENVEKFAQLDPELAETILEMPAGFERQKLVYKSIKALAVHRPQAKEQTIQEKIDSNRRSPYYQPSSAGAAPYSQVGDYSDNGQKQAYEKMQALKKQLRI